MQRRRPKTVGLLWRWHRRLGLVAALFVLLLSVSGIVLNHSSELGLDSAMVEWSALRRAYGDGGADLPAYRADGRWVYRAASGRVYLDAREVAPCRGGLVGAEALEGLLVVACAEELLLLTADGQLIESAISGTGLPVPVTGIGATATGVVLQSRGNWWLADLDGMAFDEPAPGGAAVRQRAPGTLPVNLRQAIPGQDAWLNWERLLLDLHSGRLFGPVGVGVVDAIGVLLCALALSGVAMWWLHRRPRRRT
ncbi:PepSY domain-containing protein [Pseudomonadota bacterium]